MKTMSKITIGLVAAALLMVGCTGESAKTSPKAQVVTAVSEASLGLRKTDLYTEDSTTASKTEYRTSQPMGSAKIKRAFQDAPPMIPHDTTGMLPIKTEDNRCVSCHMPEMAGGMGATPIPVSHFTDFRPKHKVVNGTFQKAVDNYKNEVSIVQYDVLQGSRFNCTLCHAPQSQGNLAVENTFEPTFTTDDGATNSSWAGRRLTDSLDTVKGAPNYVTPEDVANANSAAGSLDH
ncbi:MAG: nitrate reductase cytochrome c-type subunit [Sulfurimonas sp.]|nr:nitrate reductase cytochrome c-type subunit [Sulfurimonas sp.]